MTDIQYPDWYLNPAAANAAADSSQKPASTRRPTSPTYAQTQAAIDKRKADAAKAAASANINPYGQSSVQDAIDAQLMGTTSHYIGVPDDYHVVRGYQPTDPRYAAGEIAPGSIRHPFEPVYGDPRYTVDDVNKYYGHPELVTDLQIGLYNHGYLKYITGVMDEATASGLWDAYRDANKAGIPLSGPGSLYEQQDLNLAQVPGGVGGPAGDGGAGAVPRGPRTVIDSSVKTTSRANAQAIMMDALTRELGRGPTASDVTRFVNSLNATFKANPTVQTTQYDALGDYAGSSTVTPDLGQDLQTGMALNYARSEAPAERRQYQGSLAFDAIAEMLGM
jgi:hypothetical protein